MNCIVKTFFFRFSEYLLISSASLLHFQLIYFLFNPTYHAFSHQLISSGILDFPDLAKLKDSTYLECNLYDTPCYSERSGQKYEERSNKFDEVISKCFNHMNDFRRLV